MFFSPSGAGDPLQSLATNKKVVPLRVIKGLSLDSGIRLRSVVNLTPWGKRPHPLNSRLGGPENRPGLFGEEKYPLSLPRLEPQSVA